jgi:hypothetical protein
MVCLTYSLMYFPALYPKEDSRYSFLLETEFDRKD